MQVRQILQRKGREVITATPDTSLRDAARLLKEHQIGALVITNGGDAFAGIVSEHDIVEAVADKGAAATAMPVARIMTREVMTCSEDDTTDKLMEIMTEKRVRHLPVVENGKLTGLVSIGDVVKQRMEEIAFEAEQMKAYIATG